MLRHKLRQEGEHEGPMKRVPEIRTLCEIPALLPPSKPGLLKSSFGQVRPSLRGDWLLLQKGAVDRRWPAWDLISLSLMVLWSEMVFSNSKRKPFISAIDV
jgi:hypothetical protein